jgi:hypothetical protein
MEADLKRCSEILEVWQQTPGWLQPCQIFHHLLEILHSTKKMVAIQTYFTKYTFIRRVSNFDLLPYLS